MEQSCYRHPDNKTRVSCSGCGRPICPDCMIASPVGMRCPECLDRKPKPVSHRGEQFPRPSLEGTPKATIALIVICVIAFFVSGGFGGEGNRNEIFYWGSLFAPPIAEQAEYWRLVSYGFLHSGIMHIGFNMLLLWFLGSELERSLGTARFLSIYFAALLGGAVGALALSPSSFTVGASGAIYGLMGASAVILYMRGINPFRTPIGMLLIINILFSFIIPGVSIGGHLGGLIIGALVGLGVGLTERGRAESWFWGLAAGSLIACSILSILLAQSAAG